MTRHGFMVDLHALSLQVCRDFAIAIIGMLGVYLINAMAAAPLLLLKAARVESTIPSD